MARGNGTDECVLFFFSLGGHRPEKRKRKTASKKRNNKNEKIRRFVVASLPALLFPNASSEPGGEELEKTERKKNTVTICESSVPIKSDDRTIETETVVDNINLATRRLFTQRVQVCSIICAHLYLIAEVDECAPLDTLARRIYQRVERR